MALSKVYMATKNTTANGAALLLLAVYLGMVVYRGNVKDFALQVWKDVSTRSTAGPAFWQWAIALLILYALAENPNTSHIFGPLLAIALVAMLLQLAIHQPKLFATLNKNVGYILGGPAANRT